MWVRTSVTDRLKLCTTMLTQWEHHLVSATTTRRTARQAAGLARAPRAQWRAALPVRLSTRAVLRTRNSEAVPWAGLHKHQYKLLKSQASKQFVFANVADYSLAKPRESAKLDILHLHLSTLCISVPILNLSIINKN